MAVGGVDVLALFFKMVRLKSKMLNCILHVCQLRAFAEVKYTQTGNSVQNTLSIYLTPFETSFNDFTRPEK